MHRAYLDIETTGLSRNYHEITIIGIALEKGNKCNVIQLMEEDICPNKLLNAIKGIDEIYSYNGSRFDLPFIKTKMGIDIKAICHHTDLMYICWKNNLYGGLKAVENTLGIKRKLKDIDGFMAVKLWWDYVNKK